MSDTTKAALQANFRQSMRRAALLWRKYKARHGLRGEANYWLQSAIGWREALRKLEGYTVD